MGQVASYVAQNESQYQFPNYNAKDRRVYQKSKPMLEFIFGWSDASKCKKAIRQTHSHLKVLKSSSVCTVKRLRDDIEKLMKAGETETAFKVDQLYEAECKVDVYDLLAQFCERILFHLSHIRRNKSCPKDVMEAISSLIFASARCKELGELLYIRKLFRGRYGKRLDTEAVNLLPGNHVNIQIIEKLSIDKVLDKVKHKLLEEINKSNMNQAVSANTTKQTTHIDLSQNPLDLDTDSEFTSDSSTKDIYEGIHEFKSPLHKGCDQRGFIFISSPHHITHNIARRHSVSSADNERKMPLSTGRRSVSSAIERGMSLPCERTTTPLHEKTLGKSCSLPPLSPHVHPKLTEYDVIPYENKMPLSTRRHSVSSADNEKNMPLSTGRRSVSSAIERGMSLPCERTTAPLHEKTLQKSYSLPPPSPHVHPKLPDFDVIQAMFMDLKKKRM